MMLFLIQVFTIFAVQAQTDVSLENFHWARDGKVHVSVQTSQQHINLSGHLPMNAQVELENAEAGIKAQVRGFKDGFITVAVTETGAHYGHLFILEYQRQRYTALNQRSIKGNAATLFEDVEQLIHGGRIKNNWPHSLTFRALLNHTNQNSSWKLSQFLDALEREEVKTVDVAQPKRPQVEQGPPIPPTRRQKPSGTDVAEDSEQRRQEPDSDYEAERRRRQAAARRAAQRRQQEQYDRYGRYPQRDPRFDPRYNPYGGNPYPQQGPYGQPWWGQQQQPWQRGGW